MAKRHGAEFWQGHLAAWHQSDLTQMAYCTQHGCKPPSRPTRTKPASQGVETPRNGSSSSIRLFGQAGSFSRVSRSQAAGSSPLRRAVPIRL